MKKRFNTFCANGILLVVNTRVCLSWCGKQPQHIANGQWILRKGQGNLDLFNRGPDFFICNNFRTKLDWKIPRVFFLLQNKGNAKKFGGCPFDCHKIAKLYIGQDAIMFNNSWTNISFRKLQWLPSNTQEYIRTDAAITSVWFNLSGEKQVDNYLHMN